MIHDVSAQIIGPSHDLTPKWQGNHGEPPQQMVFFQENLGWWNIITPRKFNIAPENKPSQKESNLPTVIFRWLC